MDADALAAKACLPPRPVHTLQYNQVTNHAEAWCKTQEQAKVAAPVPFWKQKGLEALAPLNGKVCATDCGRCCLVKLEDEDTGEIHFTGIACKLFDKGHIAAAPITRTAAAECGIVSN